MNEYADGRVYQKSTTTYVAASDADEEFLQQVVLEETAETCHRIGARLKAGGFESYSVSAGQTKRGRMKNGQLDMEPQA